MSLIFSGTDGLSDVDGSAATPAIRGTDVNTGIFFGTDITCHSPNQPPSTKSPLPNR